MLWKINSQHTRKPIFTVRCGLGQSVQPNYNYVSQNSLPAWSWVRVCEIWKVEVRYEWPGGPAVRSPLLGALGLIPGLGIKMNASQCSHKTGSEAAAIVPWSSWVPGMLSRPTGETDLSAIPCWVFQSGLTLQVLESPARFVLSLPTLQLVLLSDCPLCPLHSSFRLTTSSVCQQPPMPFSTSTSMPKQE